jgi:putative hydrolase of the HAD superfamily
MTGKYELLLFDLDGTLIDYDKTEAWNLAKCFRQLDLDYEESRHLPVYQRINQRLWEEFEKGLIAAPELRVKRFREFYAACGIKADPRIIARVFVANQSEAAFLFDETEVLLETLRPAYKLGVITNGLKEVQRTRLNRAGVDRYMDCVAVSDEVGIQKPEPGLFAYALEAAGHRDKSTTLIIGDSLTSDIQGGINFGIDTCWFNPKRKKPLPGIIPTYEIRRLPDLLAVLAS